MNNLVIEDNIEYSKISSEFKSQSNISLQEGKQKNPASWWVCIGGRRKYFFVFQFFNRSTSSLSFNHSSQMIKVYLLNCIFVYCILLFLKTSEFSPKWRPGFLFNDIVRTNSLNQTQFYKLSKFLKTKAVGLGFCFVNFVL